MKSLKHSVAGGAAADAALKRHHGTRSGSIECCEVPEVARRAESGMVGYCARYSVQNTWPIFRRSPKAAEMLADVTGNSLPGITATVTNVERWRSNPLYEFFKSGVALWGRQHQRAVDAMARTTSSA